MGTNWCIAQPILFSFFFLVTNTCNGLCVLLYMKFDCQAVVSLLLCLTELGILFIKLTYGNIAILYIFLFPCTVYTLEGQKYYNEFFYLSFFFAVNSLYSCGPGVLQWNLTWKNEQFRLLLRRFTTSYLKDNSASRICHLCVLHEPLTHLLSCRRHLNRPHGQHKVLPISERICFLSYGSWWLASSVQASDPQFGTSADEPFYWMLLLDELGSIIASIVLEASPHQGPPA